MPVGFKALVRRPLVLTKTLKLALHAELASSHGPLRNNLSRLSLKCVSLWGCACAVRACKLLTVGGCGLLCRSLAKLATACEWTGF
jgi:hypothetical protein